jgi:hypothetical protein
MREPDDAFALLHSVDAFYLDHRECEQLQSAVDDRPGGRIVLTCSCGNRYGAASGRRRWRYHSPPMDAHRLRIIDLLERRVHALGLLRRIARGGVDASIILHWLGHTSCAIAMKAANEYVHAAGVQRERIEAARRQWADLEAPITMARRSQVFHEIHYYFICWDAVWKRLTVIKDATRWRTVRRVWRQHRREAENYATARDRIEHYDEWLAGRPKYKPTAQWDHGNLKGSEGSLEYSLAGRQWDVSHASLERLRRLVSEFADAVMNEGTERLLIREMNKPPKGTPP